MSLFSFNQVVLLGRLGNDPEVRYTQNGKAVMTFSIATDRGSKNGGTDWHRITLWNPSDYIQNNLKKGSVVLVNGSLRNESWQDNNGNKRTTVSVVANSITLVNTNGKSSSGNGSSNSRNNGNYQEEPEIEEPVMEDLNADDIPF